MFSMFYVTETIKTMNIKQGWFYDQSVKQKQTTKLSLSKKTQFKDTKVNRIFFKKYKVVNSV